MRCDIEFIWNFDPKVLRVLSFFFPPKTEHGISRKIGYQKRVYKK